MEFSVTILCLLVVLQCAHARHEPLPVLQQTLYFPALHAYPAYHIVKPQQARFETTKPHTEITELTENVTKSSSTQAPASIDTQSSTKAPEDYSNSSSPSPAPTNTLGPELGFSTGHTNYTRAEFPHDLLEIARSKLGLKSLDEVPSMSELAEFLGTANAEETIKYIRQMTSTEQGIALIKAYLESADFTDRTEETRHRQQEQGISEFGANTEVTKNKNNFLDRIAAYFHIYNLWPQSGEADNTEIHKYVEQQLNKYIKPQMKHRKHMHTAATHHQHKAKPQHKPILVRDPLPYHYPVPLRRMVGNRLINNDMVGMSMPPQVGFTPVHMNTPKLYIPSMHLQLARATNIPPQQLQTLLQTKPKLAELAAKVSNLPLTDINSTYIDAQLVTAVKRAIEHDEDLRKLLQSTAETLK